MRTRLSQVKPVPAGITFEQPLEFGDWPLEEIEKVIADLNEKYDLSKHELEFVSRGGYRKCQGYGEHEACDDLLPGYGRIVWRRVKA